MQEESETGRPFPAESAASAAPERRVPWILHKEKFVRAMCMVGVYVFGAIFLISILAIGLFTLVSVVLAVLFLASLTLFFALWILKRRR